MLRPNLLLLHERKYLFLIKAMHIPNSIIYWQAEAKCRGNQFLAGGEWTPDLAQQISIDDYPERQSLDRFDGGHHQSE